MAVYQVMLDTVGAEMQVANKTGNPISLLGDGLVVLTPDRGQEPSSELLPINFDGLAKVCQHLSFYHGMHDLVEYITKLMDGFKN